MHVKRCAVCSCLPARHLGRVAGVVGIIRIAVRLCQDAGTLRSRSGRSLFVRPIQTECDGIKGHLMDICKADASMPVISDRIIR